MREGKREGGKEAAWKEGVTKFHVMYKQKSQSHESKITVVMCVIVAHLVGEFSCDDAILDEQHNGVVCDDSH